MIPEDAIERLLDGCKEISKECELQHISEWEIVGSQGYGRSLDIEAGRLSLASGAEKVDLAYEFLKMDDTVMLTWSMSQELHMQFLKHCQSQKLAQVFQDSHYHLHKKRVL